MATGNGQYLTTIPASMAKSGVESEIWAYMGDDGSITYAEVPVGGGTPLYGVSYGSAEPEVGTPSDTGVKPSTLDVAVSEGLGIRAGQGGGSAAACAVAATPSSVKQSGSGVAWSSPGYAISQDRDYATVQLTTSSNTSKELIFELDASSASDERSVAEATVQVVGRTIPDGTAVPVNATLCGIISEVVPERPRQGTWMTLDAWEYGIYLINSDKQIYEKYYYYGSPTTDIVQDDVIAVRGYFMLQGDGTLSARSSNNFKVVTPYATGVSWFFSNMDLTGLAPLRFIAAFDSAGELTYMSVSSVATGVKSAATLEAELSTYTDVVNLEVGWYHIFLLHLDGSVSAVRAYTDVQAGEVEERNFMTSYTDVEDFVVGQESDPSFRADGMALLRSGGTAVHYNRNTSSSSSTTGVARLCPASPHVAISDSDTIVALDSGLASAYNLPVGRTSVYDLTRANFLGTLYYAALSLSGDITLILASTGADSTNWPGMLYWTSGSETVKSFSCGVAETATDTLDSLAIPNVAAAGLGLHPDQKSTLKLSIGPVASDVDVFIDSVKVSYCSSGDDVDLDVGPEVLSGGVQSPVGLSAVAKGRSAVIVVGTDGRILRSTDGGKTWSEVDYSASVAATFRPDLLDVAYRYDPTSGGMFVAVGEFGFVLQSTDEGATWSQLDLGTDRALRSVTLGVPGKSGVTIVGHGVAKRGRPDIVPGQLKWRDITDDDVE